MIYCVQFYGYTSKSTLLNILSSYDQDYEGEVNLNNLSIGYLYQDDLLLKNLTVKDNLKLEEYAQNKIIDQKEINIISTKLGIDELLDKKVSDLSGGERKKLSIAQLIIKDKDVIFLDEPTANIEKTYAKDLMQYLLDTFKEKIVLIATHDQMPIFNRDIKELTLKGDKIYGL
ncbi:ATP-binding cassette domain-containing protein [Anaerococcus sp.]|uniref:ATP-binding cassette domain-containing protein n=1 Tax=Anaerococcus nagyae TaxID=1755241 RepID=A0A3E2TGU7_9FIRM|nr:ATP-binding cassette domain-containing protein [Anaerococcus sp.]MDU3210725.1 ATP-binding cassette domain-containing protein [Anaerococcus sp.]RGB75490.1 ATP-binding cassette domain-containing protein [Anaerococcus nagyae]